MSFFVGGGPVGRTPLPPFHGAAQVPSQRGSSRRAPRLAYPLDDRDDDDSDSVVSAGEGSHLAYPHSAAATQWQTPPSAQHAVGGGGWSSPVPGLPLTAAAAYAAPPPSPFATAPPPPPSAACRSFQPATVQAVPPGNGFNHHVAAAAPFFSPRNGGSQLSPAPHRHQPSAAPGRGGGWLIGLSVGNHGRSGAPHARHPEAMRRYDAHPLPPQQPPPGCGASSDDTLEALSLAFLAGCRPTFALLVQCAVFAGRVFLARDRAAWASAASAVAAWAPAVDAASLASIVLALRSEGLPAKAALAPPDALSAPLHQEAALAAVYFALLQTAAAASAAAAGALFYGGDGPPELPPLVALAGAGPLPAAASLLALPALFAAGQVATHVCLLFPRAEALLGTHLAVAAVGAAWAAEAAFLPLYVDPRFTGYRLAAAALPALASLWLFAAHRRVAPMLFAHWALAAVAAATAALGG